MHDREELYVNGKWVKATGTEKIKVINPSTEEIIGTIPVGNLEEVDYAIESARESFNYWSKSKIGDRIEILNSLAASLKERSEEIAQIITSEVGTPIGYSRTAMVGTPRVVARSYAKILETFQWEEEVRNSLIVKEPIGVCAFITPWNFPLHQIIGLIVNLF